MQHNSKTRKRIHFSTHEKIGMTFVDGGLVRAVAKTSQAERNGVKVGWIIESVQGELVSSKTTSDITHVITKASSVGYDKIEICFLIEMVLDFYSSEPIGITFEDGGLVQDVLYNSQAGRLGVSPGWIITTVNQEIAKNKTVGLRKQIRRASNTGLVHIGFKTPQETVPQETTVPQTRPSISLSSNSFSLNWEEAEDDEDVEQSAATSSVHNQSLPPPPQYTSARNVHERTSSSTTDSLSPNQPQTSSPKARRRSSRSPRRRKTSKGKRSPKPKREKDENLEVHEKKNNPFSSNGHRKSSSNSSYVDNIDLVFDDSPKVPKYDDGSDDIFQEFQPPDIPKDIENFSVHDVCNFVKSCDCSKDYSHHFNTKRINGFTLKHLTIGALKEIGVQSELDCARILANRDSLLKKHAVERKNENDGAQSNSWFILDLQHPNRITASGPLSDVWTTFKQKISQVYSHGIKEDIQTSDVHASFVLHRRPIVNMKAQQALCHTILIHFTSNGWKFESLTSQDRNDENFHSYTFIFSRFTE